jgi:copper chaperone
MSTTTLEVTGMTCGHCVMTITEAISDVPGVTGVQVDLATGKTVVTGDAVDEAAIREAIAQAGYGTR